MTMTSFRRSLLTCCVLASAVGLSNAHDHHEHETCGCASVENNFVIDCDDTATQLAALDYLLNNNCQMNCTVAECQRNYYIIQSHHDFCFENELPEPIEDSLHTFEGSCEDCDIIRKFDPSLPSCPEPNCADTSGNDAYQALLANNCADNCDTAVCRTNFQTLRAVHDICEEDVLSEDAEVGIHDFEEPCEVNACNVGTAEQDTLSLTCTEEEHDHLSCACAAIDTGFTIRCDRPNVQLEALSRLRAAGCDTDCSSSACKKDFFIIQTHHDYCLESEIPELIEDGLHDFEEACEDCEIIRKVDPNFQPCPAHSCDDNSGNLAYQALLDNGCDSNCNRDICRENFQTLRAVHDLCDEDTLEQRAETGIHDFEEPCEEQGCNVGDITLEQQQLVCTREEDEPGPSPGGGGGGISTICFSGLSTVTMEDGSSKAMKDVKIGDRVQVSADGKFDTVYSFGHYGPQDKAEYLRIQTAANNAIEISALHMLFLQSNKAVPASAVRVGDVLVDGQAVTTIDTVTRKGAFAPFTHAGSIVVNNVVASSYVSLSGRSTYLGLINMQLVAHVATAPRRILCSFTDCSSSEEYNDKGVATWIPYETGMWLAAHETQLGTALLLGAALAAASRRMAASKGM